MNLVTTDYRGDCVYKITNMKNGKLYIGSSVNCRRRINDHISALKNQRHSNSYLQRSWNKYGENMFVFELVEKVLDSEELRETEQKWMDYYESFKSEFGYNINPNASSSLGRPCSEETKRKISEANKGRVGELSHMWGTERSPETKRKIGEKHKGKVLSKETRMKMSDSKKGLQVGVKNGTSILNEEEVVQIKLLIKFTYMSNQNIGKIFNISKSAIDNIEHVGHWSHISIEKYKCLPEHLEKYVTDHEIKVFLSQPSHRIQLTKQMVIDIKILLECMKLTVPMIAELLNTENRKIYSIMNGNTFKNIIPDWDNIDLEFATEEIVKKYESYKDEPSYH